MSNIWGIPAHLENRILKRDKKCVYCGVKLSAGTEKKSIKNRPTWEHIINDASIITYDNIAICCASCNSSKGTKTLTTWLLSDYCNRKKINKRTVAPVIKRAIRLSNK